MALTVVVRSGGLDVAPRITFDAPRIVIGRGEGCEVRLPDQSVSHRHASIRQRGSEWVVLDEGSTNGTFVGATRLSPAVPRTVRSGDMVRLGRVWLCLEIEAAMPTSGAPDATKEIALALVASALAAQGEDVAAKVTVTDGPDAGRELYVTEFDRRYVAGRGGDVDLTLDDEDASRRHLEIFRRGEHLWVRDLGSKNGTKLGGAPLRASVETIWGQGESLEVGADRLSYEDPVAAALDELEAAADERLREGELLEPPDGQVAPPAAAPPAAAEGEGAPGAAPVVARPKGRAAAARGGWRAADVAVAVLALLVLVSSLIAMWWLFG